MPGKGETKCPISMLGPEEGQCALSLLHSPTHSPGCNFWFCLNTRLMYCQAKRCAQFLCPHDSERTTSHRPKWRPGG